MPPAAPNTGAAILANFVPFLITTLIIGHETREL